MVELFIGPKKKKKKEFPKNEKKKFIVVSWTLE